MDVPTETWKFLSIASILVLKSNFILIWFSFASHITYKCSEKMVDEPERKRGREREREREIRQDMK